MNEYGEYSTVENTRGTYLSSVRTVDDDLILQLIRQVSRDIDRVAHRKFYPVREVRYFDTPEYGTYKLNFDSDLIELVSVTNGDGASISTSDLKLFDYNTRTKRGVILLPTVSTWKTASGFPQSAIAVDGVWGTIYDTTSGWQYSTALSAALLIAGVSFSSTPGLFSAGQLLKVDSEILYVSSVIPANPGAPIPTTVDTVNVQRAVNGTVVADHVISSYVYLWSAGQDVQMLTAASAVAYYNLKSNPMTNSFTVDGVNYQTPKDVIDFIRNRLMKQSLIRIGFA